MSTTPKKTVDTRPYEKALVYAILLDITHGALHNLGNVHTSNQSKTSTIIYDEITAQAKSKE